MTPPRTLADIDHETLIAEAEIAGLLVKHAHYVRVNGELFTAGQFDLAEVALAGAADAIAAAEITGRVLKGLAEERLVLVASIAMSN